MKHSIIPLAALLAAALSTAACSKEKDAAKTPPAETESAQPPAPEAPATPVERAADTEAPSKVEEAAAKVQEAADEAEAAREEVEAAVEAELDPAPKAKAKDRSPAKKTSAPSGERRGRPDTEGRDPEPTGGW